MDGGRVKIIQTKAVKLGSQSPDGSQIPVATLNMVVVNGQVPSFGRAPAESAFVNAFEIDTGNDFTLEMATDNNFFIGVAGSPGGASSAPIATFRPEPGNQYQIQPSNVFFISVGQPMQVGQLVDVARMRNTLRIDFANSGPNVTVNHTPNGRLAIAR
ncbi:hypothetical protein FOIG_13627 [Fusarium odoratissimum NRRL 54006]|uniref:Uncharacterized protein n=2 Tax=Fusarium oxysporum species complex TaxID=171631 RepID=X0IX50_FUSO5|nr:uncharacterized protein FOIG_13627 [Fusarium odoratissimum NRRL 54006]EXL93492.1 hypothetical protein FOIG_13627 [Fusarium odoratissimum NRRL 54006]